MRKTLSLCLGLALTQTIVVGAGLPAQADEVKSESSSSSSSVNVTEKKGHAFKYGQRLKDWRIEIDKGINKGWLSAADAQKFNDRLTQLGTLNDTAKSHNYPKPELDDVEKQFNQFNIDLSHATEKGTAAPATPVKTDGK